MNDLAWIRHLYLRAMRKRHRGVYLIVSGEYAIGFRVEVRPGLWGIATGKEIEQGGTHWRRPTALVAVVSTDDLGAYISTLGAVGSLT